MDVALIYDYETNHYIVYRGFEPVLDTPSCVAAIKKFEELCTQIIGANN